MPKTVHVGSVHPFDVGFDLRAQNMRIRLPEGDRLQIDYEHRGARLTAKGSRAEVIECLRKAGYRISEDE